MFKMQVWWCKMYSMVFIYVLVYLTPRTKCVLLDIFTLVSTEHYIK